MANKMIADVEVEATKQIYNIAREQSDIELARLKAEIPAIEDDSFALGAIKTNKAHRDFSEFVDALVLYRAHKNKSYKKGGLTWEAFCQASGIDRRNADRIIEDITPVVERFSDNLSVLSGLGLSDIRYLGKSKTDKLSGFDDDGNMIAGEETIPGTRADILAYINHKKETHKKEKEDLEAALSAQEKVIASKEDVINRQERELKRMEKTVVKSDLTPEEQDAVNLLVKVQQDFMTWIMEIKKKIEPRKAPEIALRQLYYLYIFISKIAMEERLFLQEAYPPAEEVPWEIMDCEIPPPEMLIDNLPATAGKGMGAKVREAIDKRAKN